MVRVNVARVAELLRELADELESEPAVDAEAPAKKLARPRQARPFPRPLNDVCETDKMKAQQMLRRRGMSG